MTEEELVRFGQSAQTLLDSYAFNEVVRQLKAEFMDGIMQTRPDAPDKREEFYRLGLALDFIVGRLSMAVAVKDNIQLADQIDGPESTE